MTVDEATTFPVALRTVAEPLRWRMVQLLAGEELCVCHLVEELGVPQPLVSHHLRALREAGLVEGQRYRYWTYYRLRPEPLRHLADVLGGLADQGCTQSRTRRPCC